MTDQHPVEKPTNAIDSIKLRNALGSFATGITVVTALGKQGQKVGMTVNSFNSVSLDPPLVLWSIDRQSNCFDDFMQAEAYAVHVLSHAQQTVSDTFATSGSDKFASISCQTGLNGVPVLPDYSACFECKIANKFEGGDHIILVGEVLRFDDKESRPLVFYRGGYQRL